MKETYFVVYFGEDGISIRPQTRAEVKKMIKDSTEDSSGENPFVDKLPSELNSVRRASWEMEGVYPIYKHLIIKGEMIVPEPVKTVTEYKFK